MYNGIDASTGTLKFFSISSADFIVVSSIFAIITYIAAITIPTHANIITSFVSIKITNGKKKKNKTLQLEEKTSEDKANVEDGNNENDESLEAMQEMNNTMMYMVPIMSISIAFIAPLGLALYWLVSNILIIIERLIIDKIFNKEEDENA